MNIKELKSIIELLPDDMLVGGSGNFGEFLDIEYVHTVTDEICDTTWLTIGIEPT